MAMDMLEHEGFTTQSSISSRGSSAIITMGDDGTNAELSKSFLLKRMEIQFFAIANTVTDDASSTGTNGYLLIYGKTSVDNTVDTPAEQFDARLEDRGAHQSIIWVRPFMVRTHVVDDADQVLTLGYDPNFSTSKSFSKGFRLDKDENYQWSIFNPGTASADSIAVKWLRVRYWGVHIE